MLARKGIFTTPSIMQPYVSTVRAFARVACIASHLHILYHNFHGFSIVKNDFSKKIKVRESDIRLFSNLL